MTAVYSSGMRLFIAALMLAGCASTATPAGQISDSGSGPDSNQADAAVPVDAAPDVQDDPNNWPDGGWPDSGADATGGDAATD